MTGLFWRPDATAYAEAVLADRLERAAADIQCPSGVTALMFGDLFSALQDLAREGSPLATVGGVVSTADYLGSVRRFALRRNIPELVALALAAAFDRHAIPIHAAVVAQMIRRRVDDLKPIGPPDSIP